jgi:hypothetical protein
MIRASQPWDAPTALPVECLALGEVSPAGLGTDCTKRVNRQRGELPRIEAVATTGSLATAQMLMFFCSNTCEPNPRANKSPPMAALETTPRASARKAIRVTLVSRTMHRARARPTRRSKCENQDIHISESSRVKPPLARAANRPVVVKQLTRCLMHTHKWIVRTTLDGARLFVRRSRLAEARRVFRRPGPEYDRRIRGSGGMPSTEPTRPDRPTHLRGHSARPPRYRIPTSSAGRSDPAAIDMRPTNGPTSPSHQGDAPSVLLAPGYGERICGPPTPPTSHAALTVGRFAPEPCGEVSSLLTSPRLARTAWMQPCRRGARRDWAAFVRRPRPGARPGINRTRTVDVSKAYRAPRAL